MNRIFIVIYSNLMEDENDQIVGAFSSRESALNFITYLRKEKRILDGSFEVHLVKAMSTGQNIAYFEKGIPVTTLAASTWCTKKVLKPNQVVIYDYDGTKPEEETIEIYKEEKENDN